MEGVGDSKRNPIAVQQGARSHFSGQFYVSSRDGTIRDQSYINLIFIQSNAISLFLMHSCLNMSNAKPLDPGMSIIADYLKMQSKMPPSSRQSDMQGESNFSD